MSYYYDYNLERSSIQRHIFLMDLIILFGRLILLLFQSYDYQLWDIIMNGSL